MVRLKEKGQAMAEFALMIPILILLLFGMTRANSAIVCPFSFR